ncbi:MAG: hypothetical protein U0232_18540 [Thermomicrobiales bacterium]
MVGELVRAQRLPVNPIIRPDQDARIGGNINGPSLIRVPDWVPNRLGRYYLYFAHHQGTFIRLAYADELAGPWKVYSPGVLDLADSYFSEHLASPDIHIDNERRVMRMYYHGCCLPEPPHQFTRVALSTDGVHFTAREEILGVSYWRGFVWRGWHYGLAMPGILYRSRDPLGGYEQGPTLFTPEMRHSAVQLVGDTLRVFYTNAGDCPERIFVSEIALGDDWLAWTATPPVTLLAPELEYEGVNRPLVPSERGSIHEPAHQLRDPCIFEEDGRTWLLYAVAGEHGIAIAELVSG